MLCQFLLYNMNQLLVYMYPLPREPPSHPSRSSLSPELSSLCYIAASYQLSILYMVVYICQCYSLNLSHLLLPPLHAQVCSLRLCLYSSLQIGSSAPFFQIAYISVNIAQREVVVLPGLLSPHLGLPCPGGSSLRQTWTQKEIQYLPSSPLFTQKNTFLIR